MDWGLVIAPTAVTLAILLLVACVGSPDQLWARVVVMTTASAAALNYGSWRLLDTIPAIDSLPQAIWLVLYLFLEIMMLISGLLSFIFLTRRRNRTPEADDHERRLLARGDDVPSVDVMIATYNEDRAILERTIVGALALDWPRNKLTVWVLDDGNRDWLEELCQELGACRLVRAGRNHAKAGNINAALKATRALTGGGDYILVLDADFVPYRTLLNRTIGFFDDATVGLVQTPQHFFNGDPIQSGIGQADKLFDEQRFFFDIIQPAKDAWGCAFCCGTSAVIRRQALEQIGGMPTDTVTEDALTTYRLEEIGFRTIYLNEKLSQGLAPEGLAEYVVQRSRWCLGSVQQVRTPWGPFGSSPMKLLQRVSLFDAQLYWILSFQFRLALLITPPLYLLTGISVFQAELDEALSHLLPLIVAGLGSMVWVSRGRLVPIVHDVTQLMAAFDVIPAAYVGLIAPKGQKFKVTPKGLTHAGITIQWGLLKRFVFLALFMVAGLLRCALVETGLPDDAIIVASAWTLYNLMIVLLAAGMCIEPPKRRLEERFQTDEPVALWDDNGFREGRMKDLSVGGALIQVEGAPPEGDLRILVREIGTVRATVVSCRDGLLAVKFEKDDGIHRAMIRKLFSGRYHKGATHLTLPDAAGALARWMVR